MEVCERGEVCCGVLVQAWQITGNDPYSRLKRDVVGKTPAFSGIGQRCWKLFIRLRLKSLSPGASPLKEPRGA